MINHYELWKYETNQWDIMWYQKYRILDTNQCYQYAYTCWYKNAYIYGLVQDLSYLYCWRTGDTTVLH